MQTEYVDDLKIIFKIFSPVGGLEAGALDLGEVEGGVRGPRGDGPRGDGVVFGGRGGDDSS